MKKHLKIFLPVLLVVLSIVYAINWAFFDIQRLEGQELLE